MARASFWKGSTLAKFVIDLCSTAKIILEASAENKWLRQRLVGELLTVRNRGVRRCYW